MVADKVYNISAGISKVFASDFNIQSYEYVRVYLDAVGDGNWVIVSQSLYYIVNDNVVFKEVPTGTYVSVQVASVPEELLIQPSYGAILAVISAEITALAGIQAEMESLYADKAKLDSLYADKITLDSLYADKAKLDSLYADKAKLDSLYADKITLDRIHTSIANIDTVAGSIANVDTVALNVANVNAYANTYFHSHIDDATVNAYAVSIGKTVDEGDLYFNTTLKRMMVFDGLVWGESLTLTTTSVSTLTNKTLDSISNDVKANALHYEVKAEGAIAQGDILVAVDVLGTGEVRVAKQTSLAQSAIGIARTALATGEVGMAMTVGVYTGWPSAGLSVGDILYPNGTGGLTSTPTIQTGNSNQPIAFVGEINGQQARLIVNVHSAHEGANLVSYDGTTSGLIATNVQSALDEVIASKGAVNGIASLDTDGRVPSAQLPSYVDDVVEVATYASLPITGELSKIYIVVADETSGGDTSSYRWTGTVYALVSNTLTASDVLALITSVDGAGSGLDADLLDGFPSSNLPTGHTILIRDSAGDTTARLFRSTHVMQTTTPIATAGVCFRTDTTDNYMRFMDKASLQAWLGGGVGWVSKWTGSTTSVTNSWGFGTFMIRSANSMLLVYVPDSATYYESTTAMLSENTSNFTMGYIRHLSNTFSGHRVTYTAPSAISIDTSMAFSQIFKWE